MIFNRCSKNTSLAVKISTLIIRRFYAFDHYKSPVAFRIRTERKNVPYSAYTLLVFPAACFGLGVWQIFRLKWKLNLLHSMKNRTQEEALPLPKNLRDLRDIEYRRIKVKGTFLHDEEFVIHPRVRVDEQTQSTLFSENKNSGGMVVTPFKLADRDLVILIHRGWVPKDKISKSTRPEGQVQGEVEIIGITRNNEKRPTFAKKSNPSKNFYAHRDVEAMAYYHDTAPVYLEAVKSTTVPGGPLAGQTLVNLRNEHAAYVITWFSLSAATIWLWFKRFYKFR